MLRSTDGLENEMRVLIIESERGWGQKIDEVKEFATREEAEKFCCEYNDKHNPPMDSAPDWYMYARMEDHERGASMLRGVRWNDGLAGNG